MKYLLNPENIDSIQSPEEWREALEVLRSRFHLALNSLSMGVWDWNPITNELIWDENLYRLFNIPPSHLPLTFETWASAVLPEDLGPATEAVKAAIEGKKDFDTHFRIRTPQSEIRYIRGVASVIRDSQGQAIRMTGLNWDVTEEVLTKEKLEKTTHFFQTILNCISDPIFVKDENLRWIFRNKAFSELLNQNFDDFSGKTDRDLFPPDMPDVFYHWDREVFNQGGVHEKEEVIQSASREALTVLTKTSVADLPDGSRILVGVLRDISLRKRAEMKLRNLEALIESAQDAYAYFDLTGRPLYFNATLRKYGWSLEGKKLSDFLDSESVRILFAEAMPETLYGRTWQGEVKFLDVNLHEYMAYYLKLFPIFNEHGDIEFIAAIGTDMREKKEQELKLIHSSKLASLGEMSGQIAHEINNPLAVISGRVQHLRLKAEQGILSPDYAIDVAQKIEQTVDRISKIIRALKVISRQDKGETMDRVDLSRLIEDVCEVVLERLRSSGIELRLNVSKHVFVKGRAVQLEQVLMNLLNNAMDAVSKADNAWIKLDLDQNENWVTLSVIDSGPGISEDVQLRLMEPFFTTKPLGRGTGIGLSISRSIVETHHGVLEYDANSPNTRFFFRIPALKEGA